jgi:hypothetical protein
MAFALRQSIRSVESSRGSSICRVHTCIRCQTTVDSSEPCSFVPSIVQLCPGCAGQEHALSHLPISRTPWGAALARTYRP